MVYSQKIELYQIKYTQITFLGLVNIKKNIGSFSEISPESRHKWKLGLKITEKTPEQEYTKTIMWAQGQVRHKKMGRYQAYVNQQCMGHMRHEFQWGMKFSRV